MKLKNEYIFWALIFVPAIVVAVTSQNIQYSLGKASGLVCLSALAISFILGCRTSWLSDYFESPNRVYRLHHQVSVVMLLFLVLHIIFTALPFYKVDLEAALDYIFDFKDFVITSGWLAFGLLLLGFATSYLKHLNRKIWKWLHRILIFTFPLISIHFWLSTKELNFGEYITLALWAVAFIVLLLHFLFPSLLRKFTNYEVMNINRLSSDIVEIKLSPLIKGIKFLPGQYIYMSVDCVEDCGVSREFHPFTIFSSPISKEISVAVKSLGKDSEKLQNIKRGNKVIVEGPYGNLLSNIASSQKQLWIAGGIGITPYISYLRYLNKSEVDDLDIFLLLLLKKNDDNVFDQELKNIPNLKIKSHVDNTTTQLDIIKLLPDDWKLRDIVISGSSDMVKYYKKKLYKMGADRIYSEEFDY